MKQFAVMASGGGTDFQSLIDAVQDGRIPARICLLIASKPEIGAIARAQAAGIPVEVVSKKQHGGALDDMILQTLKRYEADFAVLAGYLDIIGTKTIAAYENKIINIHPALIPSFCGMGFYGSRVHQAAIDYGVKLSGATVHFVTEEADAGPIILQKAVEVLPEDTAQTLGARVLQLEHEILPQAVALMAADRIRVQGRTVFTGREEE